MPLLYPCALLKFKVPVLQDLVSCFSLSLLSPDKFNGPVCIWTPEHTGISAGPRKDKFMNCYCYPMWFFKLILVQRQRKGEDVWIMCHTSVTAQCITQSHAGNPWRLRHIQFGSTIIDSCYHIKLIDSEEEKIIRRQNSHSRRTHSINEHCYLLLIFLPIFDTEMLYCTLAGTAT